MGKDWFANFLPQSQKQQVHRCFLELLAQEFHPYYQNPILTKSGQSRAIAWNNTLLHNAQGEIIGTTSIGEDITERQMMERTKDEFISVVSHELRTPLASIQGGLNLISSGLMNPESAKGRHVIEIVAENADRLVLLVNDILELERLKLGKVKLLPQTCNAGDLMGKARDMMQVLANRSRITLAVFPQAIQIYADCDRIIQVLTNLLSNAIKFAPEGSTISLTVELQEESKQVLFKVEDQGRGIPADKLESIFERFQQVDASDSRKKGGTGLGLAICRSIIEQHGGKIWAESVLEQGSTFCFTLPESSIIE
jgi:signal transduction histidine kinase